MSSARLGSGPVCVIVFPGCWGEWRNGRRAGFRCQCPSGRGGSSPPSPTMSGSTNCRHQGHELYWVRDLCVWWGSLSAMHWGHGTFQRRLEAIHPCLQRRCDHRALSRGALATHLAGAPIRHLGPADLNMPAWSRMQVSNPRHLFTRQELFPVELIRPWNVVRRAGIEPASGTL